MLVSCFAKCFLNKAIFEYMVESTRAKKARMIASAKWKNTPFVTLKPAARLVSSLHSIRKAKIHRIAVEQQEAGGVVIDASLVTNSSNFKSENTPKLSPSKNAGGEAKYEKGPIPQGARANGETESDEEQTFSVAEG